MNKLLTLFWVNCVLLLTISCSRGPDSPEVRIATNPWPGYELLFVAEKMGYFEEEGLNIKLLQLASLVDVQRTYNQGRADGMTSTVIEAIIVAALNNEELQIVYVPDYSDGGDVIVSDKSLTSMSDLKGKKIGVETGSLGIVILERALAKQGMKFSDVQYKNSEQLKMLAKLQAGDISAAVTYPPFSTEILRNDKYHEIFTTKEIPGEIIDVITVRREILEQDAQWKDKFMRAWDKAYQYLQTHREQAVKMMAEREGISEEEFAAALNDMHLLSKEESIKAMNGDGLKKNIESICNLLVDLKTVETDCRSIDEKVSVAF